MRFGIIGSGPAGFFVTEKLLKLFPNAQINIIEARFCPFGLIRYGVAPDHPEVKNCEAHFSKIAKSPNVSFYGGIRVGQDIPLSLVEDSHNAVIVCTGISKAKPLDIPGIGSMNVFNSRQITGWYNGDPEFASLEIDMSQVRNIVIIGNGNVALDVSRIFLKDDKDLLSTDISLKAQQSLSKSALERLYICARRGPLESAFAVKEFREMHALNIANIFDAEILEILKGNPNFSSRRTERLVKLMASTAQLSPAHYRKQCLYKYFHSPVKVEVNAKGSINSVLFKKQFGHVKIPADLMVTCIGYTEHNDLPFTRNVDGSIVNLDKKIIHGDFPYYVAGWAGTGAKGTIADTMLHSFDTVLKMKEDFKNKPFTSPQAIFSDKLTRLGIRYLTFRDWEFLNQREIEQGAKLGKSRLKLEDLEKTWSLLRSS